MAILTMLQLRPYVFGFLVAFLFLGIRRWGVARTLIWLVVGYGIAWGSEALSIRTGFPYGWYYYKYENLTQDILVAGVPLWDSLSYTFLIFAGYTTVQYRWPRLSPAATAIAGGAATMLLDIMIDPVANLGHLWFLGSIYFYPTGGAHFGVPISNYIGWFFVSWLVISGFQRLSKLIVRVAPKGDPIFASSRAPEFKHTQSLNDGDADKWGSSVTGPVQSVLYPAFYLAIGLFNTLIAAWIGAWGIVAANSAILMVCTILLFKKRGPS